MSGGKKRSGFQITSVTSELQSESSVASHGASSHPSTPSLKKKYVSHDALGSNSNSRFRVVRLAGGGGRGLPYRRGRWTCSDFLERQEGAGIRRVIDSMRHAHSLESLELIGRETDRGGVHSQEPIGGLHRSALLGPIGSHGLDPAPPPSPRPRVIPPPLRLDRDAEGRSVLRLSHSQPSSPPLDQTIFNLEGDDSSSSNSLIAIDNKIEQAMDLVKSHLMLAVREEVEQMKDQIKDLQDENQRLERENHILRTLTRNIHT